MTCKYPPDTTRRRHVDLEIEDLPKSVKLLGRFAVEMGPGMNHLLSYNQWVTEHLPSYISSPTHTVGSRSVRFTNVKVTGKPTSTDGQRIYPIHAVNGRLSYSARVTGDATIIEDGKIIAVKRDIFFGSIPIMKGSVLCWLSDFDSDGRVSICGEQPGDCQGYFIVRGGEKSILSQDKLAKNEFVSSRDAQGNLTVRMTCVKGHSMVTKGILDSGKDKDIKVFTTSILKALDGLHVFAYFIALQEKEDMETTVKQVFSEISSLFAESGHCAVLAPSVAKILHVISLEGGLDSYLQSNGVDRNALRESIFTNCSSLKSKYEMLKRMVVRIIMTEVGQIPLTDLNAWEFKRIDGPGREMERLFNGVFDSTLSEWFSTSDRFWDRAFNDSHITDTFVTSCATAQWGRKQGKKKEGVVMIVPRESHLAVLSAITRVTTQAQKRAKLEEARSVKCSQFGYICCSETPESASIGLTKNLAVTCWPSMCHDDHSVLDVLKLEDGDTSLILNGCFIKLVKKEAFEHIWNTLKRHPKFFDSCIFVSENSIEICTGGGRLSRPVIKLPVSPLLEKEDIPLIDLITSGSVEFIHSKELEKIRICETQEQLDRQNAVSGAATSATRPGPEEMEDWITRTEMKFTHMEIHPSSIFGVCASIIPCANHNKAPRITYETGMLKQTLGMNIALHHTTLHTMHKSMVSTRSFLETGLTAPLGVTKAPAGNTLVVAISLDRANNEDAIIINGDTIDSLMHITKRKTMSFTMSAPHCAPTKLDDPKIHALHTRGPHAGLPRIGAWLGPRDVVTNATESDGTVSRNRVSAYDSGYVERVVVHPAESGSKRGEYIVKIVVVQIWKQKVGDKFSSRFSQKGTCGRIVPGKEMIVVKSGPNAGMRPDIILNPMFLITRITAFQMMEFSITMMAAIRGKRIDVTSFNPKKLELILDETERVLKEHGLKGDCTETMIRPDGITLEGMVVGLNYYQALRHHAEDKIQSRNHGRLDQITGQPPKGREQDGGLRFGYMENNALYSHGAAHVLNDRNCLSSDPRVTVFCRPCGTIGMMTPVGATCPDCGSNDPTNFFWARVPFSLHVMTRQLNGLMIEYKYGIKKA